MRLGALVDRRGGGDALRRRRPLREPRRAPGAPRHGAADGGRPVPDELSPRRPAPGRAGGPGDARGDRRVARRRPDRLARGRRDSSAWSCRTRWWSSSRPTSASSTAPCPPTRPRRGSSSAAGPRFTRCARCWASPPRPPWRTSWPADERAARRGRRRPGPARPPRDPVAGRPVRGDPRRARRVPRGAAPGDRHARGIERRRASRRRSTRSRAWCRPPPARSVSRGNGSTAGRPGSSSRAA